MADDEKSWTQEYAYRLLETLKTIPCDKFEWMSKFSLTDELLENDIVVDKQDGGYEVRISSAAFYYANPFLVDLEGVRGRFFSKRLHHALVNFCTDFGRDEWRVNHILTQRFGCSIFVDDYESLTVTNEDAACFQKFVPSELVSIINMFEEMHLASIIHNGYTGNPEIMNVYTNSVIFEFIHKFNIFNFVRNLI